MITHSYKLDMCPGGVPLAINLSQYDSDVQLVFELFASRGSFVIESGTTVAIRGTKPDGNGIDLDAAISDNVVTVSVTQQMTAVAGTSYYELTLYKGEKELNTANFRLIIERAALDKDTLISGSEIRELVDIIDRTDEIIRAAADIQQTAEDLQEYVDAKEAEISQITTDAEETAQEALDEVTNVKNDLDQKAWNIGTYNRFDLTKIQPGIIFKSGAISSDSDWSYSDYIPITPGETLYAYGNSASGYCLYDSNRSVVSNSSTPNWSNPYVVPENAHYIRMTFQNAQLENAYLSTQAEYEEFNDIVNSIESVKDKVANLIDTSLSLPNKAADAKTTGDKLDEIHSIYYTDENNEDITQDGVVKKDYYYSYYNGNEYGPYSNMWEYITYDVTVGEKYFVSAYAGTNCRLWIFRNDSGVISYSDDSSAVSLKSDTITVPAGATKLIVNARTASQTEINAIFVAKSLSTPIIKPTAILSNILSGKVLCCAGDSITYGADMDATGISHASNIDAYQSDSSGNFTKMSGTFLQTWGYQIAARNGMTFYNAGVSGSTMQGLSESNGFSLANGRYTKLPDSIDYLIIWFGWNDAAYGTLGTISDATNESYYGGYNVVLPYLINKYPYAKIGLIVPFGTDANHREAIRLLGNKWGVAVWDNYQGGTPLYYDKENSVGVDADVVTANRAKFQANGAHPNYKGHTELGHMIEHWMRGL